MTSRRAQPVVPRLNLHELDITDEMTSLPGDKRVILNIGGIRHETRLSTLEMIPGTRLALLAHLQEADETFDITSGEYFFDRHPRAFESVLQYCRTEELHIDKAACGNVMKSELTYWGIEENEIEPCCWADYSRYTEHKETLRDLDNNFAYQTEDVWEGPQTSCKRVANNVWMFLEEPTSSRMAKVFAILSMFFVALSIAIFVLESHPLFQVDRITGRPMNEILPKDDQTPTGTASRCCCESNTNTTKDYEAEPHQALRILDYICVGFFTLEVIIRFAFCPNKVRFWKAPLNLIDVICLLPHYISIALGVTSLEQDYVKDIFRTLVVLRIVRILRIFKLMKHYNAFKILVYTIKVSTKELLLMIVFLMSGVLMFASIMHYAEEENFPNIPIAIWWALVTMTTVGYGDKYPVGYIGYGVGSVCVICGVLVIAFTVPIVVNNFSLYYSHAQTRIKIPKRKKRILKERGKTPKFNKHVPKTTRPTDVSLTKRDANFTTLAAETQRTQRNGLSHRDALTQASTRNRNTQRTGHGGHTLRPGKEASKDNITHTTVSPIETSDRESCDSGYTEPNKKKIEEEARQLMDNMADADRQRDEERKRQEAAARKKREERAKKKAKDKEGK